MEVLSYLTVFITVCVGCLFFLVYTVIEEIRELKRDITMLKNLDSVNTTRLSELATALGYERDYYHPKKNSPFVEFRWVKRKKR